MSKTANSAKTTNKNSASTKTAKKTTAKETASKKTGTKTSAGKIPAAEICDTNANEIIINGKTYIPKPTAMAKNDNGQPYVLIRTYSAGVHIGYLKEHSGTVVTLAESRRIWMWSGAFTCSEIATAGVTRPDESKLSTTVPEITLTEAVEIIPCTQQAYDCLTAIPDFVPSICKN